MLDLFYVTDNQFFRLFLKARLIHFLSTLVRGRKTRARREGCMARLVLIRRDDLICSRLDSDRCAW